MPLPMPQLDDRTFQDLVDEAKRLIPRYCPEWTDHNVSDPGVTLIELFAWMVDMMIYRLNRVPDKNYIAFMDLLGMRLLPPAPARANLTFWLSAPAVETVPVPMGTQVSTQQTQQDLPISFTTDEELHIYVPKLLGCFTSPNERVFDDQTWRLAAENESFLAFSPRPRPGDAFYLGYEQNISGNIVGLTIDCSIEGIGVDPKNPPLLWEALGLDGWVDVELERDTTGGLNTAGQVVLMLPEGLAKREINGVSGYWLRCLYVTPQLGQPPYAASPTISSIVTEGLGGTVTASHAIPIIGPTLGRSDGGPGQRFFLEYAPVLPREKHEFVELMLPDGSWQAWEERADFASSGPDDRHYTLDSVSGEINFGPAIREPDGTVRQYGAIPQRGALLRFTSYRHGGGALGNVGAHTVRVLQNTVPYVDRVTNRRPATGGRDAETIERAKLRAPRVLRTSMRAITAEDYEFLAQQASQSIARACCLQPRAVETAGPAPGMVRVLLIPSVDPAIGRIDPDQLRLPPRLLQTVQNYLDERRQLTTLVTLSEPEYRWVQVEAQIKARINADPEGVRKAVLDRLYRFINPLIGGEDGKGWPFSRSLYPAEIYSALQGTPGVEYIQQITLKLLVDGVASTQNHIEVPLGGMLASAEHQVVLV